MIWGIYHKDQSEQVSRKFFKLMSQALDGVGSEQKIYLYKNLAIGSMPLPHEKSDETQPIANRDRSIIVVFQGKIYNTKELLELTSLKKYDNNPAEIVLALYEKSDKEFVNKMNGKFAFAIFDNKRNKVILGRDRFGIEPLYYTFDNNKIIFSTSLKSIINNPDVKKELNFHALYQFLLFCYNPALYTFFKNVNKLRPGHVLIYDEKLATIEPYWKLSFANVTKKSEDEIASELLDLMKDAVKVRVDESLHKGVFLSGGMDSSTVVALTSAISSKQLSTFSYRCRGETFDESHYARIVADRYHTNHHLTEYSADDVESITELVKMMDEPFCDVGINIATYILAKAAQNQVNCIFSGDGGDELYGGHPVYVADKTARLVDAVPAFIIKPFTSLGKMLPDSDKKKNLVVKVKRFSESYQFPKSLFSHRWRIYYHADDINKLMHKDILGRMNAFDPYQVMLRFNKEVDGKDILSRSIYSDYNTVVGFYLRRMGFLRHFGIDARFPLLDHRLVEYAATVPSSLKIRGMSDTKYIFKKAMENTLPHDIVYRKDKLGHSIPLKNWMRDNTKVKTFITDLLSESALKQRGFFNPQYVSKMIHDHLSKTTNNSHRLWALVVLELWLRDNL